MASLIHVDEHAAHDVPALNLTFLPTFLSFVFFFLVPVEKREA